MTEFLRGDLYYANLSPVIGSEQAGHRPVLIIQNNTGNQYSPTVIIASVTSKPDAKAKLPTHCYIKEGTSLKFPSVVLLEQLRTIDKKRLKSYIGKVDSACMKEIDCALAISVGLSALPQLSNNAQKDVVLNKEDEYVWRKNCNHE